MKLQHKHYIVVVGLMTSFQHAKPPVKAAVPIVD